MSEATTHDKLRRKRILVSVDRRECLEVERAAGSDERHADGVLERKGVAAGERGWQGLIEAQKPPIGILAGKDELDSPIGLGQKKTPSRKRSAGEPFTVGHAWLGSTETVAPLVATAFRTTTEPRLR